MPHTNVHARLAERRAEGRRCAVSGCCYPVQMLGGMCSRHDCINERTGDPRGYTVRMREVRPYLRLAEQYIQAHQDRQAIRAALTWIYAFVYSERPVLPPSRRTQTPRQRLDRWLQRMARQGLQPDEFLALLVGMFLLQERKPATFRSHSHFKHQTANRLLRQVRAPFVQKYYGGTGGRNYERVNVGLRELMWSRIEGSVGLLALRIARIIAARLEPSDANLLANVNQPLPGEERHNQGASTEL